MVVFTLLYIPLPMVFDYGRVYCTVYTITDVVAVWDVRKVGLRGPKHLKYFGVPIYM